ncbi:preprotein translocase subunit SecE [Listeria seeligeri]|uniref:Protein translocase subunit SecE n=1 Tax=Listeria seeligeri TaxID=1640 RepID=A0A7X0X3E3_LISSE|nr:preprotein translocase subunit SecE [Listeria seeligeri]MBC1421295.1 preprotein translocase subunit SecE [Listeria seeligeri]MBC1425337.1 preprotein translocase subunit SecE [Listeria seeligeri]MBC1430729.1 preprotein translocase subunit SecE [Listeria seeligeri]MBC1444509.1 preprotein translocase subunit SecE [Listeria seeligeri]MBC1470957.1 preprotein translocase subunit SecE [Listeria seeligeri]
MSAIARFFRNVSSEMHKVTWPTRKELLTYTVTVVITVILFALFFMVIDFGIEQLIQLIM